MINVKAKGKNLDVYNKSKVLNLSNKFEMDEKVNLFKKKSIYSKVWIF